MFPRKICSQEKSLSQVLAPFSLISSRGEREGAVQSPAWRCIYRNISPGLWWGMLTPCCCFPPSREIPDCQYHQAGSAPSSSPALLLAVTLFLVQTSHAYFKPGMGSSKTQPFQLLIDLPVAVWFSLEHFTSRGLCSRPSSNTLEFPICESILFPIIPPPTLPVGASPSAPRHVACGRGGGLTQGPAGDAGQGAMPAFCRYSTQALPPSMALLPETLSPSLPPSLPLSDMDECETFGSEFCRNGQCLNTVPGYKCFCRTGYFYDSSRLECVGKMASKSSGAPRCAQRDSCAAAPRVALAAHATGPALGDRLPGTLPGKERGGGRDRVTLPMSASLKHCSVLVRGQTRTSVRTKCTASTASV